ncbi:MAG: hypothetical protein IJ829_05970 [Kiritimatiellae bacterium]|nr:hypothetical protein [Kiritimatiellia bacterium]
MRLCPKWGWFAAFTTIFAVCAAYVFWGTWSTEFAPVMPDCAASYSAHWFLDFLRGWLENGKFAPAEAINWIGSPYLWTEFQYAFAAYMSALALAYFLRGRGLPRVAAYGAGLLLAFSGYWFTLFSAGHLGWFQWMTYGVFVFGLVDRALEKGKIRHWVLLGACLAWASMRQPDLWLLFSAFSGVYFVFRLVVVLRAAGRDGRPPLAARWAKGAAIALAALLVIGGASFRSAFVNDLAGRERQIERGETVGANVADDAERRWIFTTNWSMPPEATFEFWHAGVEGDTSCPFTLAIGEKLHTGVRPYTGRLGRPLGAPSGNYRQHSLYVGCATLLFAALAAFTVILNRRLLDDSRSKAETLTILFFLVAAVVFWLFSMGRYCAPVYRLVYALPFGDYLRAPVKWHHLTELCLCVLAGYGISVWTRLDGKFIGRRGKVAGAVAAVLLGTADLAYSARLYCAPHRADADMQFMDGRITQDPRGIAQLNQMRARVLGTYQGAALVEVPRQKKKDEPKPELPSPQPATLALGLLSLVGTLGAIAYGVKES